MCKEVLPFCKLVSTSACQLFDVGSPPVHDRESFASINRLSREPFLRRLRASCLADKPRGVARRLAEMLKACEADMLTEAWSEMVLYVPLSMEGQAPEGEKRPSGKKARQERKDGG